jgi:hypothetical protein
MSWLIPSALGLAAAAIIATVVLHFIARSRPVAEPLPTARFVPRRPIQARTRSLALSDVLLLLLRAAALAIIGIAVAGPMFARSGRVRRVFVVDRSRAVADLDEARDNVRRLAQTADKLVVFDSVAERDGSLAPLDTMHVSSARGSLSAAIAAAVRMGVVESANVDSIELVLVSPFVREEMDEATARIRASWPGRIRLVPTRSGTTDTTTLRADLGATRNDAVVAGLSLMKASTAGGSVRLIRGRVTASDSTWVHGSGHVIIHWPTSDSSAAWPRRATIDAIGGVTSGRATLVARFPRLWVLNGNAIAHWADGEPAAVEHPTGDGCIRDVAVVFDDASDVTLRSSFREFARPFFLPCGGATDFGRIEPSVHTMLGGSGPLASATALMDRTAESSRWSPWLLALAALLLTGELAYRRATAGVPVT